MRSDKLEVGVLESNNTMMEVVGFCRDYSKRRKMKC